MAISAKLAKSWNVERRVIARVEAGPQGADSRFIVTNLRVCPRRFTSGLSRPEKTHEFMMRFGFKKSSYQFAKASR